MAKLSFYYGAMGCSKTANALMQRFQYIRKNKRVWLIKSEVDSRDDRVDNDTKYVLVKSRIGIEAEACPIKVDEDITDVLMREWISVPDLIICDEAQFLTRDQVDQLKYISEVTDIPVCCYGLRTDFKTNLFPGSMRLFEIADEIHEISSICSCGNSAIVNARFDAAGNLITEGAQVELGGDDKYEALCWSCWKELQDHV